MTNLQNSVQFTCKHGYQDIAYCPTCGKSGPFFNAQGQVDSDWEKIIKKYQFIPVRPNHVIPY